MRVIAARASGLGKTPGGWGSPTTRNAQKFFHARAAEHEQARARGTSRYSAVLTTLSVSAREANHAQREPRAGLREIDHRFTAEQVAHVTARPGRGQGRAASAQNEVDDQRPFAAAAAFAEQRGRAEIERVYRAGEQRDADARAQIEGERSARVARARRATREGEQRAGERAAQRGSEQDAEQRGAAISAVARYAVHAALEALAVARALAHEVGKERQRDAEDRAAAATSSGALARRFGAPRRRSRTTQRSSRARTSGALGPRRRSRASAKPMPTPFMIASGRGRRRALARSRLVPGRRARRPVLRAAVRLA